MSDIFLSYNREDQAIARHFADGFENAGLKVWWDTTLRTGEAYDEVTEAALRGAKAVVVLWSPRSVVSRWVRAEATLAERAKTFLPVTIEPCERPIMFELTQTADLTHWKGDPSDPDWQAFVEEVRRFIAHRGGEVPPPRAAEPAKPAPAAEPAEPVLAVLAFDNLSNDPELTYFSDGVSEEILYTVARTKDLKVLGKASSFQFRGAEKSAHKISSILGATHLLDGSVRRSGDNIRISVELVDTKSLESLWIERYDRALTDIFALQDEIAGAIAETLERHFAPAVTSAPVNPAAYDLYLQARAIYTGDMSWEDRERIITLLESAVALDPDFAQAWGLLAAFRMDKGAKDAADRAIALNPECAHSYAGMSLQQRSFKKHCERLELSARSYEIEPQSKFIAIAHGSTLCSLGLISEALEVMEDARDRDPLSPIIGGFHALLHCYLEHYEEAIALADELVAKIPHSDYPKWIRGAVSIYTGDLDGADRIADTMSSKNKIMSLRPPVQFMRMMMALDADARATAVQQFLLRNAPTTYLLDVGLASIVGETEAAITHLFGALDAGNPILFTGDNDGRDPIGASVTFGLFMPAFKPIRMDPRFAEICVRLGVYECWKKTGKWPDCVEEVAAVYDLRAACAAAANKADATLGVSGELLNQN